MKRINIPKQDLIDYYTIMGLSSRQIGKIYNCSNVTICNKMIKFNIPRRLNKGHKTSEETKKKISETLKGKNKRENNPNWKGDKVSNKALHTWIKTNKPKPECCEICGKKTNKLDCSNKDHKYSRNLEDYQYLCKKCHAQYDLKKGFRYNKIKKGEL